MDNRLAAVAPPPPADWKSAPADWAAGGFDWEQVRRLMVYMEKASRDGLARPLCETQAERIAYAVYTASLAYDLEPALILSLISTESTFHNGAVSPKGARGLMQLMPLTGRYVAGELGIPEDSIFSDPARNVHGGAFYLRHLLNRFRGHLPLALAAYNIGPTDLALRRQEEGFRAEDVAYVRKVLYRNYSMFRRY